MSKDDYETWIQDEMSNTINCFDIGDVRSTTLVCYCMSSYDSNAMKSSNPHSGCYEAETSRTLEQISAALYVCKRTIIRAFKRNGLARVRPVLVAPEDIRGKNDE